MSMEKIDRSIRLHKIAIQLLRDLRDSHPYGCMRKIPELANCCLKQTRGVETFLRVYTPRNNSEKVDIKIDPEFKDLETSEIAARVSHALIGIQAKLNHEQMKLHRQHF